ncbi:DNA mismatch repair protein MutS [Xinfangfangia sp. D13-10-4-6]|uniref:Smr/MutS family protein n=1 Tax=Pseudogemmobacter hezensis TaxID=2737662 RepID=UPI001555A46D|nr:Smr/MutS family protein [Pseudogemmobacter hezensis]NPD14292.1 DNA mismatch repair protein MutS [Pseudogemmobacter hezensis]
MARRRQLRPEERELWQAVARTLRPMRGSDIAEDIEREAHIPQEGLPGPTAAPGAAFGKTGTDWPLPASKPFRLGERAAPSASISLPASLTNGSPAPLRLDAGLHRKMLRGKLAPEARIDLHGMTLAGAHPALIGFLMHSQASGKRLVLVITGKGKQIYEPVPRPTGALRHQVPHWLRLPPLSAVVQEVLEAHLRHGGAGAFYVWLRRG